LECFGSIWILWIINMPRFNRVASLVGIIRDSDMPYQILDNATISSGTLNFKLTPHYSRLGDTSLPNNTVKEGDYILFSASCSVSGVRQRINPLDLYWVNIGTTASSDFLDNINSGPVSLGNGFHEFQFMRELSSNMDFLNGEKSIQLELRANSISGPLLCTSEKIIVVDRNGVDGVSTYRLILDKNVANEGDTVKITLITTNVEDNKKFYVFARQTPELIPADAGYFYASGEFYPMSALELTVVNNSAEGTRLVKQDQKIENDKTVEFYLTEQNSELDIATSEILTLRSNIT